MLPAFGTPEYETLKGEYEAWLNGIGSDQSHPEIHYHYHHRPSSHHHPTHHHVSAQQGAIETVYKDSFTHLYDIRYDGANSGCKSICEAISDYRRRFREEHPQISQLVSTGVTGFDYDPGTDNSVYAATLRKSYHPNNFFLDENMMPGDAFCRFFSSHENYKSMATSDCW